jgi:outer membrane protein OmpA-like peptidoglycan-associated protein
MARKITLLTIGLLFLLPVALFAQEAPARAQKQYKQAMALINDVRYEEAIKILRKTYKKYPKYGSAGLTLADVLVQVGQTDEAKSTYEKVLAQTPGFSYRPYFQLGRMSLQTADYRGGKYFFEQTLKFKNIPGNTLQDAGLFLNQCNFAIEALSNPLPFRAENLGDSINSAFDEYLPAFTADDQTIIFTRKLKTGEDFYISTRLPDGSWRKAEAMPAPLNSSGNEGAHCLSADGKTIFFTACYREDSYGGCDLYFSQLGPDGWSAPVNLGEEINTAHWETQPSLSYDGSTLYFVSNRPGGFGGSDIWMSKKKEHGKWSKPENMGPYINSRKDEISPFIHYDDQTLYFASDGMAGMGKLDIYLSKRMPDGDFGPARNLGYPINTEKDESSLFVNLAGTLALFTAQGSDSRGGADLYYFELPKEVRPEKAVYVKGKIMDVRNRKSLAAKIEIVDLSDRKVVFEKTTFANDGQFLVSLPAGKSYAFNVSRNGYLFFSQNLSIDPQRSASEVYEIALQPIAVGNEVILKNIFYQVNSFSLETKSLVELRKLQQFLELNPGVVIEIQGHTDNVGSKSYNLELSQQRAKTVYDALVRFGVDAKQLRFKGYGDSQPVADNDTEIGRSANRRTQFKVLSMK